MALKPTGFDKNQTYFENKLKNVEKMRF